MSSATESSAKRRAALVEAFLQQAGSVGAVVHAAARTEAAALATRLLREAGCQSVAVAGAVAERGGFARAATAAGLREIPPSELWPTRRADGGISTAVLGVAESGSVLLYSTSEDRRVELCVDVHLVLLEVSTLVPTLAEALTVIRDLSAQPPAYASLVSGPSRSADIERTLTVGVHGPKALQILLLGAES